MVRQGQAGVAKYGKLSHGVACFGTAWRGRRGEAWLGCVRYVAAVCGMFWRGRHGTVCQGRARRGNARLVQLWYDMAVLGKASWGRQGRLGEAVSGTVL